MKESTCIHIVLAEDNSVILTNDDDSYYCQYFNNWEDVEKFITEFRAEAFKAFGNAPAQHMFRNDVLRYYSNGSIGIGNPDLCTIDTNGSMQFPTCLVPSDWGRIDNEGNFGVGK